MQYSLALLGLAAFAVAKPMPQGVTADITPTAAAPAGCTGTYPGSFELSVVNITTASKRMAKRQSSATDALVITLSGGQLMDNKGRTGYIAANRQFQFDGPPQTGAIYTGGFSVCGNGTLALGSSAIWYECLSGSFYNLYDQSQGAQCYQIFLDAVPYSSGAITQSTDGQVAATTAASALLSTISDHQIQAPTSVTSLAILTTISDHQIQAPTSVSSAAVITQITDGQIQATTGKPSSVAVITQITDGQIQATTGTAKKASSSVAVLTQITDGQIQATTAAAKSSLAVLSQITDGQIQATTATASATIAAYTGGAVSNNKIAAAAGAMVFGAAAFLA